MRRAAQHEPGMVNTLTKAASDVGVKTGPRRSQLRLWFFLALTICVLSAGDAFLTAHAIDTGQGSEGNPIMAGVLAHGNGGMMLIKTLSMAAIIIVGSRAMRNMPRFTLGAYYLFALAQGYVVSHNLVVLAT
jgi:hypothetical protein